MTTTLRVQSNAATNLAAIKALRADGPPDREALKKFMGWGCCAHALIPQPDLTDESQDAVVSRELPEILDPEEIEAAKASILNAYYTPEWFIPLVWEIMGHLGFKGGAILEPSCGVLRFLEHQPQAMRRKSKWVAIEADPIPAAISRILYPEAVVYPRRFEQCSLPENSFDAVVGNVPFGDSVPADPQYNRNNYLIHSYFIYKSIRLARPGGLVTLITGQGTLDSARDKDLRRWMALNGELLLSLRLPAKAHEGAGASCDLLVFRKFDKGESRSADASWVDVAPAFDFDAELLSKIPLLDQADALEREKVLTISNYYKQHPDHLLGDLGTMSRYGHQRTQVKERDGFDIVQAIREAYLPLTPCYESTGETTVTTIPDELQSLPVGGFAQWEGKIVVRRQETLATVPKKHWHIITEMLELLDLYTELLRHERTSEDDAQASLLRSSLQDRYYSFVFENGNLLSYMDLVSGDPRLVNLTSLEINQDGGITQSEIFHRRTVRPMPQLGKCESPGDAIAQSLNRYGYLKPRFIAELLNLPVEDAMQSLGDAGLAFYDPEQAAWVTSDEYLSGDVKSKLDQALKHQMNGNASALRAVLPTPVLPPASMQIQQECAIALELPINMMSDEARTKLFADTLAVQLGAIWLPPETIAEFACHLMGSSDYQLTTSQIKVRHIDKPISIWSLSYDMAFSNSPNNLQKWGTRDRRGLDLLEMALNFNDPKIYRYLKDGKQELDQQATEACRAKIEEMRSEFSNWLWQDQPRAVGLCLLYNEKMNRYRHREFNGSHLTLPGSNPEITLRPHQKNAVWRALQQGKFEGTLFGHSVGSGKTFALTAFCLESVRLGVAQKPIIGVMNDTLPGFVADARKLYPHAKILYPQKEDMETVGRQRFINSLATQTYDIAILPHSIIFDIKMSDSEALRHINDELAHTEDALGLKGDLSKSAMRRLQSRKESLIGRIQKIMLSSRKRDSLTWEQLGSTAFCLDESQVVKKLGLITTQDDIAGLDTSESQRGRDTKMKIDYLLRTGGKVIFSTGTPVTNTLAELFTLMRYLIERRLDALNLNSFDAWSSLYAETETASEVSAEGGYQVKTRFARFTNLPELMALYWSFADLVSAEGLGLERPIPIYLEEVTVASDELADYMTYLQARATSIRLGEVDKEEDNLLVVVGDGRKSAADLRLVMENAYDDPESKLNSAVWCIWQIWLATGEVRGTQFVFSNIGTPKNDAYFDLYRELKQKLIALGIPEHEIAFVHDCKDVRQKTRLFRWVNQGRVRILLGSTGKGGTGVNVQYRLCALHHIEPDWRPADITQREGRIVRQGNLFKQVLIFRHVTEGVRGMAGFDAFFWQKLKQKSIFISQIEKRTLTQRHGDDIGEVTMNFATLMAIASGDPMLKDEADLIAELKKLELRQSAYSSQQLSLTWDLKNTIKQVDAAAEIEEKLMANAEAAEKFDGVVKIGNHRHTDPSKIGGAILSFIPKAMKIQGGRPIKVGTVPDCDFDIYMRRGFGDDLNCIVTSDIADSDTHYKFEINKGSGGATGLNCIEVIRYGVQATLDVFRDQTAKAKLKMKELSNIDQKPFPQAERIEEIRARLAEIKLRKKELEKAAAAEAKDKKPETEKRVKYGQALLLPPDPQVVAAIQNRDYKPYWIELLPKIVAEMRANEAAKDAADKARAAAAKGIEVQAEKPDNDEALINLLSQPLTLSAGATQDSLF